MERVVAGCVLKAESPHLMLAGAGGIEPPNGGIKISLIIQRFQGALEKETKDALQPFQ
jgi:hypothetical protein